MSEPLECINSTYLMESPDIQRVALMSGLPDGLDISSWQGNEFNPDLYKPDFIAIRAGHGTYTDSTFDSNYQKAAGVNIPIIAYWYVLPSETVSLQASRFLKSTEGKPLAAMCLDYEEWLAPNGSNYTAAVIVPHMVLSFQQIAAGRLACNMLLYTGRGYLKYLVQPGKSGLREYLIKNTALWIAAPANEQIGIVAPYKSAMFRQYGKYKTPGFSGEVDHDSFLGSLDQLRAWAGLAPVISLEQRVAALELRVTALENKGV